MKIYGDAAGTKFRTFRQEPGLIYGHHDVLEGELVNTHMRIWEGPSEDERNMVSNQRITASKVYLHVFNSFWSSLTGLFREYCLPWRWKAAYIDRENGTPVERILVCTGIQGGELSDRLKAVVGQSLFITNLIDTEHYQEIYSQEYLTVPSQNGRRNVRFEPPFFSSAAAGDDIVIYNCKKVFCPIYRIRGIFSFFKYYFLKGCSSEWQEVTIQAGSLFEKLLIKRSDHDNITRDGLIHRGTS